MTATADAASGVASSAEFQRSDYPALYLAASNASRRGQRWHRRLVAVDLMFVLAAAALSAGAALVASEQRTVLAAVTAVALVGSLAAKAVNWQRRDDGDWFDGRAVAETVKTATWKYMMRTSPFVNDLTCDHDFARDLQAARDARRQLRPELSKLPVRAQEITARMRQVRGLSVAERWAFYARHRLGDQVEWYRDKAQFNEIRAARWFWAAMGAQVAALAIAILGIAEPVTKLDLVTLLAAVAATFTAWSQFGDHEELSKSYEMAYEELLRIEAVSGQVATEKQLAKAVRDSEDAVSREHKMWMARRD